MKFIILTLISLVTVIPFHLKAQEGHGKSLNLGIGIGGYNGYYKYVGHALPVLHIDYELQAAPNVTLAPFINLYSFSQEYYWGNNAYPADYYTYREVVVPIGVKGTYYFDELLEASTEWDFYLAGSLGFSVINGRWENGYHGDKNYFRRGAPVFLDIHVGAEYHLSDRMGLFLDLSSGVSTIGLTLH